jgi:hypothetical protein
MDPNELLRRLRELAGDVDGYAVGDLDGVAREMADLFQDLDAWILRGGFLPKDWSLR